MKEDLKQALDTVTNMHKWKETEVKILEKLLADPTQPKEVVVLLKDMLITANNELEMVDNLVGVIYDRYEVFGKEGLEV